MLLLSPWPVWTLRLVEMNGWGGASDHSSLTLETPGQADGRGDCLIVTSRDRLAEGLTIHSKPPVRGERRQQILRSTVSERYPLTVEEPLA